MNMPIQRSMLTIFAVTFAAATLLVAPASGKEKPGKQSKHAPTTSAAAASALLGSVPESPPAPKPGQHDSKPGIAWKTVGGTVKSIQGDVYTVEDFDGNQMKVHVGRSTKQLRGNKKVGDSIRAEITQGGFANSVQ
ncbi:MAG: exported protein of unknown function [Nitrospira sp.]|jgi:hypothetical protein|nr:exported protein of unknown function [Nitrospira sp.]